MFLPQCQWEAGMDKRSGQRKATPLGKVWDRENCISHDSWQITRYISTCMVPVVANCQGSFWNPFYFKVREVILGIQRSGKKNI